MGRTLVLLVAIAVVCFSKASDYPLSEHPLPGIDISEKFVSASDSKAVKFTAAKLPANVLLKTSDFTHDLKTPQHGLVAKISDYVSLQRFSGHTNSLFRVVPGRFIIFLNLRI